MKTKLTNLINKLSENMFERDEVIKMAFLALLGGESIFLLGPPGTGKSMVARQMKLAISEANSFEYLMNRFSTPEEIFGPISLKALDDDKYERKIDGYLPTATVAFLDEIWKASPAIQNTLLTIINEKLFRNDTKDHKAPMRLLISASNELPAKNEGLEALFDRFLIRMWVDNLSGTDNFKALLSSKRNSELTIEANEQIKVTELEKAQELIEKVTVDDKVVEFIQNLKKTFIVELKDRAPYISDRRWKKIIWLLKTSAWASDRKSIDFPDLLLIQNMIWEDQEQINLIRPIIRKCLLNFVVGMFGFSTNDITQAMRKIEDDLGKAVIVYDKFVVSSELNRDNTQRQYCLFDARSLNNQSVKFVKVPFLINENDEFEYDDLNNQNVYWYFSDNRTNNFRADNTNYSYFTIENGKVFYQKNYELIPVMEKNKKIDKEKVKAIKTELSQLSIVLAKLEGEKAKIQNHLNSQDGIFTSNYDYECKSIINEITQMIEEISEKRNKLLGKIEANI